MQHTAASRLAGHSATFPSCSPTLTALHPTCCHSQVPPEVEHAGLDASVHGSKHAGQSFADMSVEPTMVKPKGPKDNVDEALV